MLDELLPMLHGERVVQVAARQAADPVGGQHLRPGRGPGAAPAAATPRSTTDKQAAVAHPGHPGVGYISGKDGFVLLEPLGALP